jgi:hypothetical protein
MTTSFLAWSCSEPVGFTLGSEDYQLESRDGADSAGVAKFGTGGPGIRNHHRQTERTLLLNAAGKLSITGETAT